MLFIAKTSLLKKPPKVGFLFVTTYYPKIKEPGETIRDLLPFWNRTEEVQKVFSPTVMVPYRDTRKKRITGLYLSSVCWKKSRVLWGMVILSVKFVRTCDALHNLAPFAQFKKQKNTHGGVLLLVRLQASSFTDTFSSFIIKKTESGNIENVELNFLLSPFLQSVLSWWCRG